jgi:hypothetical protein
MVNKLSSERHIDLLARTPEYGEVGEVFDNMIQMVVKGPIYGSTTIKEGEIGIWLTEQEQDDLIAGILERRGISQKAYQGFLFGVSGAHYNPITAEGDMQSSIHPHKLPTR